MQQILDQLIGAQRLLREALAAAVQGGNDRSADGTASQVIPVELCDSRMSIELRRVGVGGLTCINLHQNEQTSVKAARKMLDHHPGTLIELRAQGRRTVIFRSGLRPYAFDPNRIFTDQGLRQTLSRHASLSTTSLGAVTRLRDTLLTLLDAPGGGPVVALHNNAGKHYDIRAYASGGSHALDASRSAIGAQCRPENFFLVTHQEWFDRLGNLGFNVVLQNASPADDGSLGVWFQQQGRAYINVEAGHGQLQEQQRMLEAVASLYA